MADSTQISRFRPWLWLIALIGVIVPRRLAAGVGGRVALPRAAATTKKIGWLDSSATGDEG
jgi:hypothetical protein